MKTALILALAAAATAAVAQEAPLQDFGRGGGGAMMRADANGDGVITREEHLAHANQRFDRLDLNRDGKLTRDELERVGQRMRGGRPGTPPPPPPAQPMQQ
jgi:hypothetical protein